jgi:hypothetical protein
MVLCTRNPKWSHDFLIPGIPCPYCSPEAGDTTLDTTPTPTPSLSAVSTAPSSSISITTSTPVTSAFMPTARHAVTAAQQSRGRAITRTQSPPPPSTEDVRLLVRVAHATFTNEDDIAPTYQLFTETFVVVLVHGSTFNRFTLTATIQREGEKTMGPSSHWRDIIRPLTCAGNWQLASNYLHSSHRSKPMPQLYRPWNGERTIQDIIKWQGFQLPKGATTYPTTLIWYPLRKTPTDVPTEELLYPLRSHLRSPSPLAIDDPLTDIPSLPSIPSPPEQARNGHKRAISEAIPVTERANAGDKERPREEVTVRDDDDHMAPRCDDDVALRRSGRARKVTAKRANIK